MDRPDTKFKPEGEFSVQLRLQGADAEDLKALIEAEIEKSVASAKAVNPAKAKKVRPADPPYKDDDEIPGATLFKFKLLHRIKSKKDGKEYTQSPVVYDSKNNELDPAKIQLGGGSKIRVSFTCHPFFTDLIGAGVTLRFHAVQVVELVKWGKQSPFDAVEGGYTGGFDGSSGEEAEQAADDGASADTF